MAQRLEYTVLGLIEDAIRTIKASPMNLGGVGGSAGGVGGPPGGFIGQLAQNRVTYDTTEAATLDTLPSGLNPPSGWSLIDNLNHIRYRIGILESGGGTALTIQDFDGNPHITNVNTITFSGVVISDLGGGNALVAFSGGGGSALTVRESDGSPTVSNVNTITFSGAMVTDRGGGEVLVTISGSCPITDDLSNQIGASGVHFNFSQSLPCPSGFFLFYNGVYQSPSYYVVDPDYLGVTTNFVVYSGDSLVAVYGLGGGGGGGSGTGTDNDAIHTNVAGEINTLSEKTSLVGNDIFVIEDSAASYAKKKVKKSTVVSSIWGLVLDESGTSFANWTGISGTWSSDGTVIKQTTTTAGNKKSRYTAAIANAGCVMQAEVQFKTNAADAHVGFLIHYNGTGTNSIFVYPRLQEDDVRVEQEGTAEASLYTGYTINIDTWYTLKVVVFGNVIDTYLDGVLVGSTVITQSNSAGRYIGLGTTNTEGWFRNIKVWNLSLPV